MKGDLGILFGVDQSAGWPTPTQNDLLEPIEGGAAAPELCQLAERWRPDDHPAGGALGQVKLDGWRALYIGGPLVSREAHVLHQAAHSLRALQELERAFGKPMFFDGEYVHPEGLEACGRPGGTVWLFDAVPLDVWRRDGASAPFDQRIELLLDRGQHCFGPALGALAPFSLPSARDVEAKRAELEILGYEGLIVKQRGGQYRRRRHNSWGKVKHWRTVPCRITDVLGGAGAGFQTLLVMHEGKLNKISSGFSRAQRLEIGIARDRLPGTTALVEFAGLTANGLMRDASFIGFEQEGGS